VIVWHVPFTPAHIVAVIPLWPLRRWLPFAALATGAMVPDIAIFFPVVDYAQTHSPLGVFTTCLPMGAACFLLFEAVCRRPLIALLPLWFRSRLEPAPQIPTSPHLADHLRFYSGLAVAIVVGAFTHQIWDAFTHQGRWGTKLVPSLNSAISMHGYGVPGYKLLQYGCSILGLLLLAAFALISLRRVRPGNPAPSVSFRSKLLAAIAVCMTPAFLAVYARSTEASVYTALGLTVRLSGVFVLVLCVIYCVGFHCVTRGNEMCHQR
jgi:hypothetical protein